MELATESLSERAPKARSTDAWGDFLRRVLVSTGFDDDAKTATGAALGPLSQPDAELGFQEHSPAEL